MPVFLGNTTTLYCCTARSGDDERRARFSFLLCFGKGDAIVSKWYFVVKSYELSVLLPENFLDEDNFPDGKMTDANIKKRIKALDKKADAEELAVLQKYLDLKGDISLNKKLIKERKYDLLTALLVKYANLSEEDIKRLVIEKKWFASLGSRLDGEMQRISQQLTSKVSALAERYAQTLPEIDAEIADLEAKVTAHLKQMGY